MPQSELTHVPLPDEVDFDAISMFRVLEEHAVEYVVIGALAAVIHGAPVFTGDADICPSNSPQNLERLAAALRAMDARIRNTDVPEGLPFACDAVFLSRMSMVNLVTRFGILDVAFTPAASTGYEDLVRHAVEYELEGVRVLTAALHDVIRSKETANREKDRATLPILRALQDEIARQEEDRGSAGA